MAFLFDRLKLVTEPSGAIATAALLAGHVRPGGRARRRADRHGGNVGLERFVDLMGQSAHAELEPPDVALLPAAALADPQRRAGAAVAVDHVLRVRGVGLAARRL